MFCFTTTVRGRMIFWGSATHFLFLYSGFSFYIWIMRPLQRAALTVCWCFLCPSVLCALHELPHHLDSVAIKEGTDTWRIFIRKDFFPHFLVLGKSHISACKTTAASSWDKTKTRWSTAFPRFSVASMILKSWVWGKQWSHFWPASSTPQPGEMREGLIEWSRPVLSFSSCRLTPASNSEKVRVSCTSLVYGVPPQWSFDPWCPEKTWWLGAGFADFQLLNHTRYLPAGVCWGGF